MVIHVGAKQAAKAGRHTSGLQWSVPDIAVGYEIAENDGRLPKRRRGAARKPKIIERVV
jgi:hypothetical protein